MPLPYTIEMLLRPSGVGDLTQWTPNPGGTVNWSNAATALLNLGVFNSLVGGAAQIGKKDLYSLAHPYVERVVQVEIHVVARQLLKVVGQPDPTLLPLVRAAGIDQVGAAISLTTISTEYVSVLSSNFDQPIQIGMQNGNATGTVRVFQLWAVISRLQPRPRMPLVTQE